MTSWLYQGMSPVFMQNPLAIAMKSACLAACAFDLAHIFTKRMQSLTGAAISQQKEPEDPTQSLVVLLHSTGHCRCPASCSPAADPGHQIRYVHAVHHCCCIAGSLCGVRNPGHPVIFSLSYRSCAAGCRSTASGSRIR